MNIRNSSKTSKKKSKREKRIEEMRQQLEREMLEEARIENEKNNAKLINEYKNIQEKYEEKSDISLLINFFIGSHSDAKNFQDVNKTICKF